MAQFIEIQSTGDKRFVIRSSAVECLEMPAGAGLDDVLADTAPAVVHMRDGSKLPAYNKSPLQIIHGLLRTDAACVFLDTPDVISGPG